MHAAHRKPPRELIVGLTEVAMYAGVQKQAVSMWRTRHDSFPEPLVELRTGAVWWLPDVHAWLVATGRSVRQGWTLEQVNSAELAQGRPRL